MPAIQVPSYYTINGTRFQHASLEISIAVPGIITSDLVGWNLGLQSVDYDAQLEPGELRGASPVVLAATTGKATFTAKLKVPKQEAEYLVNQIIQVSNGLGYGQFSWGATLNYFDPSVNNGNINTDVWNGCRIKKLTDTSKVGPEPIMTEIDLFLMSLSHNGNYIVNNALMTAVYG